MHFPQKNSRINSSVDRAFAMFSHKFKFLVPNTALTASK